MNNKTNVIYVAIVAFITVSLSISFFLIPDKVYSENENRTLQTAPEFSFESLVSGEYTTKLGSYFADQFPFRDGFVASKAYMELLLGKRENNDVIYGLDDTLIPSPEIKENRMEDNLKAISFLADNISSKVTVVPLPRPIDVFSERLPKTYPKEQQLALWDELNTSAKSLGLDVADCYGILCDNNTYYRTDHHYTTTGAYYVYKSLAEKLGYTPFAEDYFKKETVSNSFCGTSMRTSGFYLTKKDTIQLYRYEGDEDYNIIADGKKIALYDMTKLKTADKYAVFLGGNHGRVDITKSGDNRPKLLIVRDSYADSLVPFLALHYDITLIDLRYYTDSVANIVREEGIDNTLILESVSEISSSRNLSYLRMDKRLLYEKIMYITMRIVIYMCFDFLFPKRVCLRYRFGKRYR